MTIGSGLFSKMKAALPHLVKAGGGLSGEVNDLRKDILNEMDELAAIAVEEYTNVPGTAAPGAAVLKVATATVTSTSTVLAAGLIASGLAMLAVWPRPISFTTAGTTPADAPATATITGTDAFGAAQTETVNLSQTAATVTGTKAFKTITKIDYAVGDGTGATIAIGIGAAFIKAATATVTTAVTLAGSTLIQTDLINNPRAIVFTTAGGTPAHAPATATVNGKDIQGKAISETVNLSQTSGSVTTSRFFAKIDSITYPVGDGTSATIAITFGAAVGLRKKIKTRAGLTGLFREISGGALVTNGVIADAATALPYGSYTPNTAFNDVNDCCIYYEFDAAA